MTASPQYLSPTHIYMLEIYVRQTVSSPSASSRGSAVAARCSRNSACSSALRVSQTYSGRTALLASTSTRYRYGVWIRPTCTKPAAFTVAPGGREFSSGAVAMKAQPGCSLHCHAQHAIRANPYQVMGPHEVGIESICLGGGADLPHEGPEQAPLCRNG